MLHTKFQSHRPEKNIFEGFYHIWAWRSSWLCDLDHLNIFFVHQTHPKEPHEICLQLA